MAVNIIDLVKEQIGSNFISQTSTNLGESESGISKAINAILPIALGGIANNADKPGILDSILGASSEDLQNNLSSGTQSSVISTILTAIFGEKLGAISSTVSGLSGISETSASSLLNTLTGATVGTLGKFASENNLGSAGLSNLLSDQKEIFTSLLPAGLSLASFGLGGNAENIVPQIPENITVTSLEEASTTKPITEVPKVDISKNDDTKVNIEPENNDSGTSIWMWLLPLLLVLFAGWFIWKQYKKKETETNVTNKIDSTAMKTDSLAAMMVDSTSMNVAKIDTDIDLNGKLLKGYKGGFEDQMITFLNSGDYKKAKDDAALKDTWYSFDHVNFKIGSATELEAGSKGQIDNLIIILKTFPDAKIKIGGYTDKTGVEADNVKLSTARANFIKSALEKVGVGAQVLGAEGYGSKFSTVAKDASNEERAVDRKMAIRFTK